MNTVVDVCFSQCCANVSEEYVLSTSIHHIYFKEELARIFRLCFAQYIYEN